MPRYRLTNDAAKDLERCFLFGFERFGIVQAVEYQDGFKQVFKLLADNPMLGRRDEDTDPPTRRHVHGSHIIYYEPEPDGILIVGVIHMSSIRKPE